MGAIARQRPLHRIPQRFIFVLRCVHPAVNPRVPVSQTPSFRRCGLVRQPKFHARARFAASCHGHQPSIHRFYFAYAGASCVLRFGIAPKSADSVLVSFRFARGLLVAVISLSQSSKRSTLKFSLERVIGNGSFGTVFEARIIETGEVVAIKKVLQDRRFKVRYPLSVRGFAAHSRDFLRVSHRKLPCLWFGLAAGLFQRVYPRVLCPFVGHGRIASFRS